jgi:hypothetical protein
MRNLIAGLAVLFALATVPGSAGSQRAAPEATLRIHVDVPDSPGTIVTLRYLEGPDSLRGRSDEVVVPLDFVVHSPRLTLVAERSAGHGHVRLRVEHGDRPMMGEGTGDRVRIAVTNRGVQVRAYPWWWPW